MERPPSRSKIGKGFFPTPGPHNDPGEQGEGCGFAGGVGMGPGAGAGAGVGPTPGPHCADLLEQGFTAVLGFALDASSV